jgi:hypothetical protein
MASRIASAPCDAGNKLGSLTAAVFDWHRGVADFHLGTGHTAPTQDAGYTTASPSLSPQLSIIPYLREESIYACYAYPCSFSISIIRGRANESPRSPLLAFVESKIDIPCIVWHTASTVPNHE